MKDVDWLCICNIFIWKTMLYRKTYVNH